MSHHDLTVGETEEKFEKSGHLKMQTLSTELNSEDTNSSDAVINEVFSSNSLDSTRAGLCNDHDYTVFPKSLIDHKTTDHIYNSKIVNNNSCNEHSDVDSNDAFDILHQELNDCDNKKSVIVEKINSALAHNNCDNEDTEGMDCALSVVDDAKTSKSSSLIL